MMCSNDEENTEVMGDAWKQTIYEIWHGKNLSRMRDLHRSGKGFLKIPVCRKCYLPRETEDGEKVTVNGREIIIENYVGRKQNVGE